MCEEKIKKNKNKNKTVQQLWEKIPQL